MVIMLPVNHVDGLPPSELEFNFTPGRMCLDLVATIGERWRRRFERLRGQDDLGRWLDRAGLPVHPRPTEQDLAEARRLRGAIELLAMAAMRGEGCDREAVAVVNGFAARPDVPVGLNVASHPLVADLVPSAAGAALASIARDAVTLFGGPLSERVRECAADECALVFVDTSRPGRRRWCSMRGCGNRAKVARYRANQADPPSR